MLSIIKPEDHQTYQTRIDSFLSLLKIYQNFSPSSEEWKNGTFIIASDNEYGVYGGALLLKKSVCDLECKIREIILTFQPDANKLLAGLLGFYRGHEGASFHVLEGFLNFYDDLLRAFNDFGNEKEINSLYLTLNPNEYLKLKNYGFWEYEGQALPHESSDGLFHGILPLAGRVK